jgi:hypothetical protein
VLIVVTLLSERIDSVDDDTESEGFEIRESEGNSSSAPTWGGVVESWKPVKRGFQDFDIQDSGDDVPSHWIVAGEIEAWVALELSREKTRQTLAYWIIGLCTVWTLFGFIVFLVFRNGWFLTSLGVLAIPFKQVWDHYFCRLKDSTILKRGINHLKRIDVLFKR